MVRQATEVVPLAQCLGRILRQDILAERDNPPFDRVCMDGVAVASSAVAGGTRRFRVQATLAAGAVPLPLEASDYAIEVMTGAVLPPGTDCIIPLEEYTLDQGSLNLRPEAGAKPWRNVQRRGEDSSPGVAMLTAGTRLGAAELAVIASAGLAAAQVSLQPRIRIVSTGDELVEPGLPIADHQVRRSNAYAITAALRAHGYALVHDDHLADDEALMRRRLGAHLEEHDVLVLSGGISKGKFDFVPSALAALGVQEQFHEVAQRPGRPMWFGVGPRGQAVFGLPGNPVATLVCLVRFVLPALAAATLARRAPPARFALAAPFGGRKFTYYLPVALEAKAAQPTVAVPRPPNGPGDFLALAGTHGFVELPPQTEPYPAGFTADFHPW